MSLLLAHRSVALAVLLVAAALLFPAGEVRAADEPPAPSAPQGTGGPPPPQDDEAPSGSAPVGFERTPPRLAFMDGDVSFWRSGAPDWAPARVNTPLAPGDRLYAGDDANLEVQIGPRAFVRAGEATQLGIDNLEPDFLQLRVVAGHVSVDVRGLTSGQTIEVDTPNAAYTIERTGYYRIEVDGETTTFTSRRGGRATVTPAGGDAATIEPSEQVVVAGTDSPQVETYAAPELDAWDRWNYQRTDRQIDARSARYVPSGVYGVDDLDRYGDWRVVPTYGAVWVPTGVPAAWAPYGAGRWLYDPYYGWSWVDDAPWGWAPFHYGRWVRVSSYWAWAPGPVVRHAVYAPALVAFLGAPRVSIGVNVGFRIGGPGFGWVSLGWGEPLVPWWGPRGCVGVPHWAGWGGPRVVNKVVVHERVVNVRQIQVYQNAEVPGAVLAVKGATLGHGRPEKVRFDRRELARFAPIHGALPVKPDADSFVPGRGPAKRPPEAQVGRPVVATRAPADGAPAPAAARAARSERKGKDRGAAPISAESAAPAGPPPRLVPSPSREERRAAVSKRPPFGRDGIEERNPPPPVTRFSDVKRGEAQARQRPAAEPVPAERRGSGAGRAQAPSEPRQASQSGRQSERRGERPSGAAAALPGEPADRVFRGRRQETLQSVERAPAPREARSRGQQSQESSARSRGQQSQEGSARSSRGRGKHAKTE